MANAYTDVIRMSNLSADVNPPSVRSRTSGATNGEEEEPQPQSTTIEDVPDGGARRRRPPPRREEEEEGDPGYGPRHVILIFIPVSLCMLAVVLTVVSVNYYTDQSGGVYLVYTPFHPEDTDTTATTVWKSVGNALIVLAVVVVMTTLLVLLYKYKCYKVLHGWLIITSLILLFLFSYIYLEAVFKAYNVAFDYISLAIILWNFGCMGMLCMHWKAPLRVLQAYHIIISALLALVFIKYLPEWTLWLVLGVIALWDLVAVLCPKGPLKILVNLAHERNEQIFPSLIYSSTVAYTIGMADRGTDDSEDSQEGIPQSAIANGHQHPDNTNNVTCESTPSRPLNQSSAWTNRAKANYHGIGSGDGNSSARGAPSAGRSAGATSSTADPDDVVIREENEGQPRANQRQPVEDDDEQEDRGVKLGLGDFIFYSILVGKAASSGDWATTLAAYIAILMGLFFTLVLLAITKRALPALPISILFGLVFNFGTQYSISPFITTLAAHQVFI